MQEIVTISGSPFPFYRCSSTSFVNSTGLLPKSGESRIKPSMPFLKNYLNRINIMDFLFNIFPSAMALILH
jgi:hypothetical protein